MTKEEAREWLNRGYKLNDTINKKLETQYEVYNCACGTISCGSNERVQTTCKNSTEDILAMYIDLSNEIDKLTDELYSIKKEILQAINRMDSKFYRKILKLRYFYFKSWGYISHKVNKPVGTLKKSILNSAIKSFNTTYCVF